MAGLQHEASITVFKKAMDIEQQTAMQLPQAIPQPAAPSVGTAGG